MTIALIPKFLVFEIPAGIPLLILVGLLIAGYAERRKGYIGRVAIFLNALLLWQIFYNSFSLLPDFLRWYLNIGSIIGILAIGSYALKKSLSTKFYKFAYWFYGSFSVLVAIGGAIYFKIPLF